jgi:hypothetical protein
MESVNVLRPRRELQRRKRVDPTDSETLISVLSPTPTGPAIIIASRVTQRRVDSNKIVSSTLDSNSIYLTMSSRRHLVQRSRNTQEVTDSPSRSLQRNSVGGGRQLNTELPPYEPLECALTPSAREQLERLQNSHDHSKYKKHIKSAILAVTEAATSSNDRLYERKFEAQKQAEKREKEGRENEEPTQDEKEEADYLKTLSRKVKTMTLETEKALRELIDYDDELAMFTSRLEGVIAQIGDAPAPRPARTRAQRVNPDGDVDSDDPDEEEPEEDVPAIAPSDLYKNTVQQYETQYRSKSMRARCVNPWSLLRLY